MADNLILWCLLVPVIYPLTVSRATDETICSSMCYCDSRKDVNCVGDSIWKFPEPLPQDTQRLQIRNFQLEGLHADHFKRFFDLRSLKVSKNNVSSVDNGTFEDLPNLTRLDLSQNLIAHVGRATFEGLIMLTTLDLSSNVISYMESGSFAQLDALQQLTIRNNRITDLMENTFEGLGHLQYLNLDGNQISSINSKTFNHLMNLVHLILSNNPLGSLDHLLLSDSQLQFIDVSATNLTRIPMLSSFQLRDLRVARNDLAQIGDGDLAIYPHLVLLVMDECRITRIAENVLKNHTHLFRLWMNGNELDEVPKNLPTSLTAVFLETNRIRFMRKNELSHLTQLEQLYLQRNHIGFLEDCSFCGLSKLNTLDLHDNRISTLSRSTFIELESLQSLDLSQNPITTIDSRTFRPLLTLSDLHLSRIREDVRVPEDLFAAQRPLKKLDMFDSAGLVSRIMNSRRMLQDLGGSLVELNLLHNRLNSLRPDTPLLLPRLKLLKLGGNRWDCSDIGVLWMTQWLNSGSPQFPDRSSSRCRLPEKLFLRAVSSLTADDFRSSGNDDSTAPAGNVHRDQPTARYPSNISSSTSQHSASTKQKSSISKPFPGNGELSDHGAGSRNGDAESLPVRRWLMYGIVAATSGLAGVLVIWWLLHQRATRRTIPDSPVSYSKQNDELKH